MPEAALESQLASAADPLSKTFSAFMLSYAKGSVINVEQVVKTFGIQLIPMEEYARRVLQVNV